ncbi:PREDICTED: vitelline membrane outer layer protein 1 homolog [Gekko japonicus]|uniref:Vitelline membrane outer layer protein 1 homolog n=1 Tax=Gekko japonicus TaxID=146911 RepID=A0ABM1LBN0_GEKJA|nr:PREDICTED: vitelline membrane outer layer protein 1 homolog [Gekko japonicus]
MAGCRVPVALAVALLSGVLAESGGALENHSVIQVPNGGPWGAWAWQEMCPEGTYATGFSIKVESYQGLTNDDTGMNGIRLHCTRGDRHPAHDVESQSGMWGKWSEPLWCPPGGYLQRFSLRVEKVRGGMKDNMGATNIRFTCSGGETLEGHGLSWGEYGVWSPRCPKGLCGVQTKQEMPRGALRDDTALNDVRFLCCSH